MKIRSVAMASVAVALLAACGDDDTPAVTPGTTTAPAASTTPSLSIVAPAPGTAVKGNVVTMDLASTGLTIDAPHTPSGDASGNTSGPTGHYHVFVDRDPVAAGEVIPAEEGVWHPTADSAVLSGLEIGSHRLVVVVADGNHARLGTAMAETTITVEGPSIDASAPHTSPAGQPVVLTVRAEGLTLVQADGDTSGATGHLHVFIDRDPTSPDEPIPVEAGIIHAAETTIPVRDLTRGTHTLWVVAGDGTHIPLYPWVMDRVVVTIN